MRFSPGHLPAGIAKVWFVASLLASPLHHAAAETSARDLQIMLKSIAFLSPKPAGDVAVMVIYEQGDQASHQEAEHIKSLLGVDMGGTIRLVTTLAEVNQSSSQQALVAVIPTTLSPSARTALAGLLRGRRVLTVSSDPACAQEGLCILAAHNVPRTTILLNAAAAEAAGVEFIPTFRMMVTQI